MKAGRIVGQTTRANTCQRLAPSVRVASSKSTSISSNTGWTVRTTKRMEVKLIATMMPS